MSARPEIVHERDHGGTTDHNAIKVSLRRKAVLTDDLRDVTERREAVIFLTTKAGFTPSHRFGLRPEQVVRLIAALESALTDWHDVDTTPATTTDHQSQPAGGGSEET